MGIYLYKYIVVGGNMKLLIAGSRSIKTFDISEHITFDVDLIICGGADGVDRIAEQYADDNRISKLDLKPQYKLYGKAAPIKRNELMVDIADKILVVWDGASKGSEFTIRYAIKKGKDVTVIDTRKK